MPTICRALLSVADKTGIVAFAQALHTRGIAILSTGGTATILRRAKIPVEEVADSTGFPALLDGRVKTLHPKIHAGILARRAEPAHMAALQQYGIAPIDLVVVNLYPFAATIARNTVTRAEAIEQIDIGGPALLRAAAKNAADVVVCCDPADYPIVVTELSQIGSVTAPTARRLACKVFAHTAAYDAAIARYLASLEEGAESLPDRFVEVYERMTELRYGENPHQPGAWYQSAGDRPCIGAPLQGKALSYNNLLDADAAVACVRGFAEPATVIVKHTNPCGVARSDESLQEAFSLALAADPVSAYGGIVACNRPVDPVTAQAIAQTFFEVVLAPAFSPEALAIFAPKTNLRVIVYDPTALPPHRLRSACGGVLIQAADVREDDPAAWRVVTKRAPSAQERTAVILAWRVARHVQSNAIVVADTARTLGIGAGQMSRVDAVRIAVMKLRDAEGRGTPAVRVAASDAFFPFPDGVEELGRAGVSAVIQPGGSVRDAVVIAAADRHGMAMVFTGTRHFRH